MSAKRKNKRKPPPVTRRTEPPVDDKALAEDDALFREAMGDVDADEALAAKFDMRIEDVSRARRSSSEAAPDDAELFEQAVAQLDEQAVAQRIAEDPAGQGRAPAGRGLRARLARAAPRGEERLDLHRLRRNEALAALRRFLHEVQARGGRVVMVITGLGKHSDANGPVLREAVEGWLQGPEGRRLVGEYYPAPPEEGGRGAFYLFLKKKNQS